MTADLTPVQQLQAEMGVEFYEWDGWPWPSNFGNPVEEYLAPRNGVGIVENSGLRKWELRGPDALRAADHIVTQDCSDMAVGRVHYTPVCNEEGMALDDITVFHLGPERVMLVSGLLSSEDHFRAASAGFDVELVPMSDERGGVQIQGPRSRDVVGRVTDLRSRRAPVLPLRRNGGRRGGVHPVAHRLQRRARLRDLRLAPGRRHGLDGAPRSRRAGRDPPVRARGGRLPPRGVRAHLRDLRLPAGRADAVRARARLGRQARQGRLHREGSASAARRRAAAPEHHRHRLRGRRRARPRVRGRARRRARRDGHGRSSERRSRPCHRARGARRQGLGKRRSPGARRGRRGRGRVAPVLRPGAARGRVHRRAPWAYGLRVRNGMRLARGPTRA